MWNVVIYKYGGGYVDTKTYLDYKTAEIDAWKLEDELGKNFYTIVEPVLK